MSELLTDPTKAFFRGPKLIWLPDRETESGESALRFIVLMELEYPSTRPDGMNTIYRVDGKVPVKDRYHSPNVRKAVLLAYKKMIATWERNTPTHEEGADWSGE